MEKARKILYYISWEDFQASRDFIELKGMALMNHENKDGAKVGFPIQNYIAVQEGERTFYMVRSNVFMHLVDTMIIQAKDKFPEKFGTGNATDVIEALHSNYPYGNFEWYTEFLRDEQFCYIIENERGTFADKIPRIDLFRLLQDNEGGGKDFTGGLMHALKYFSHNDIPLSTGKGINNIIHINVLLVDIAIAFFTHPHIKEKRDNYVIKIPISDKYQLRIILYFEKNIGVYFINTVYKEDLGS